MGERPGLFHSVPLRPYNEHMRPYNEHMRPYNEHVRLYNEHMRLYNEHIPFMMVLHRTHIIVGARWNGVE